MSIENMTPENIPDKNKSSMETKDTFTRDEQKLIDDFNTSKKYYTLDLNNLEEETKKVGGEITRSSFFEDNYKVISGHPKKYPKMVPLLQKFLENNKTAIDSLFTELFANMRKKFSPMEMKILEDTYNSTERKERIINNPATPKLMTWNKFCDISLNNTIQVMEDSTTDTNEYPSIITWYINTKIENADKDTNHGLYDLAKTDLTTIKTFIARLPKNIKEKYTKQSNDINQKIETITTEKQYQQSENNRKTTITNIDINSMDDTKRQITKLIPEDLSKEDLKKIQDKLPDLLKELYEKSEQIFRWAQANNILTDNKLQSYEEAKQYINQIIKIKKIATTLDENIFAGDMFFKEFFEDVDKLEKQLTTYIDSGGTKEIIFDTLENFGPNPVTKGQDFNIYLGKNIEQFDTLEIFDMAGSRVYLDDDIQNKLQEDQQSPLGKYISDAKKIVLNPYFAGGMYIFRLSKKGSKDIISKKFEIL